MAETAKRMYKIGRSVQCQ